LSSIIIVCAFYYGAWYSLNYFGLEVNLKYLMYLFLITCLFTAFSNQLGVTDFYEFADDSLKEESRQAGLFGNPNEAGNFGAYLLGILLTCSILLKKNKILYLILGLFAFYVAFVSFSKAAIAVSFILIFSYLLYNLINVLKIGKRNRTVLLQSFVIFLLSIFMLFANWEGIFQSFSQPQQKRAIAFFCLLQGEVNDRTTSDRTIAFAQGWRLIRQSPIIGSGFGSFHRFVVGKLKLGVHNTYLLILGEGGAFILFLFLLIGIVFIFRTLKLKNFALKYFVYSFCCVFFISVCGTGHNALYDRVSNALFAIVISVIAYDFQELHLIPRHKYYHYLEDKLHIQS